MVKKIPVCQPTLAGDEWKYVKDCLDTNWISGHGKYIDQFEQEFSQYCGVKYGIACTSGTTALHLALAAAGIKKGDEVIIPTFNIISLINAVIWTGATPVLVDSEPDTYNINAEKIEEKITPRTKAIVPVHMYGHPCEMDKIMNLATKHNLIVIEDAAEAHGAEYKGKKIGGLGHVACFSFYPNKIITTGEGGMVVTNNEEINSRARLLRDLAFVQPRYVHYEIGFNYRMTNLTAALGVAQMKKINEFVELRRKNGYLYNQLLKDVPGIKLPVEKNYAKNVYWMYSIQIEENFPLDKKELTKKLSAKGIETRDFFYPMHQQPVFKKMDLFKNEHYPISEKIYQNGLLLPSTNSLTVEDIKYIVEVIKK